MERLAGSTQVIEAQPHGIERRGVIWTPLERAFVTRLKSRIGITAGLKLVTSTDTLDLDDRTITTITHIPWDTQRANRLREQVYNAEAAVLMGMRDISGARPQRFRYINLSEYPESVVDEILKENTAPDSVILLDRRPPTEAEVKAAVQDIRTGADQGMREFRKGFKSQPSNVVVDI